MLVVRIVAGVALGYGLIVLLAWLLEERLAFPAPRAPVPDPRRLGIAHGERIELVSGDGTRLAGWYLAPRAADALHRPAPPSPALLWFYGNGENIAGIWPILRDFQPPGTALLVVRSEEHTSELQSQSNLVCRLLLEKKKNKKSSMTASRAIHRMAC